MSINAASSPKLTSFIEGIRIPMEYQGWRSQYLTKAKSTAVFRTSRIDHATSNEKTHGNPVIAASGLAMIVGHHVLFSIAVTVTVKKIAPHVRTSWRPLPVPRNDPAKA